MKLAFRRWFRSCPEDLEYPSVIFSKTLKTQNNIILNFSIDFLTFFIIVFLCHNVNILVHSCREYQFLKEYTEIFKNRTEIPVSVKPSKTETDTLFFHCELYYMLNVDFLALRTTRRKLFIFIIFSF